MITIITPKVFVSSGSAKPRSATILVALFRTVDNDVSSPFLAFPVFVFAIFAAALCMRSLMVVAVLPGMSHVVLKAEI